MLTVYKNCPDGVDRALYYKFEDGAIDELSIREGDLPEAEFKIIGDYETFAKISRAEIGSRSALMSGKLTLKGNMVKALSLSAVVDRLKSPGDHPNRILRIFTATPARARGQATPRTPSFYTFALFASLRFKRAEE